MLGKELFHIYGPFSVNTYGTTIALSFLFFLWLLEKHPLRKTVFAKVDMVQVSIVGILLGIIGGRALFVLSNMGAMQSWYDIIDPCSGGYSVLGTILMLVICLPLYLRSQKVPILPFFDLVAIYAPLLQGLSRIGCFFAGCCYGKPTTSALAVIYRDANTFAPCNVYLHPTQLYSTLLLLIIFCFMYFYAQHSFKKTGQLVSLYLLLISFERFVVDFWRDDQEFFVSSTLGTFSVNQWLCILIATFATVGFICSSRRTQKYI